MFIYILLFIRQPTKKQEPNILECSEFLSMSYQNKAYPIPSPEVKRFLQDHKELRKRPGQILIYIYV